MNAHVEELLKARGVELTLKNYKEMKAGEGFHMQGTLYVNGKKAISFEDLGDGGGCDFSILNHDNAKPLLDIKEEMEEIKAYPGDETIGHLPYQLDVLFYQMAEDLLGLKEMRRHAKGKLLLKWPNEKYDVGSFSYVGVEYGKRAVEYLLKAMAERKCDTVELWNPTENWKIFTIKELKALFPE